jgi:hypothetical protein
MIRYLGQTSDGRYFKIKKKNIDILPRGWRVFTNRDCTYYNKKTKKINSKFEAIKELSTPEDVEQFKAINKHNIDVLFGYFTKNMQHLD